jgi:hypothetical protein
MAKAYIRLTNRVDAFKDEFNNLTNKVGDISTLTTGGFVGKGSGPLSVKTFSGADSSAIEAINEVDYRLDSIDQLLDQAVLKASNVEFNEFIAKDSAEFRNNVVVDGNTNLAGELIVQDSAEFMDNVVIDGKLNVAGNTTLGGTLIVDGQVTFKAGSGSSIGFGDDSADTVDFNADIASNLIPDADATYSIGRSGAQWKNLHVHGVSNLDGIKGDSAAFTAGITVGTTLGVTGTSTLGVINASGLASLDAGIDVDGAFTVANSTGNIATTGTLNVTGLVTADGGIDVDNMHIDDTSIDLSSGDLTVSAGGDILLVPTGDDVYFRGTTSNEQIKFTMGTTLQTIAASDALKLDAAGNINLDADGGVIELDDGGTQFGALRTEGGELRIASGTSSDARAITFAASGGRSNSTFHGVVTFDSDITVNGNITTTGVSRNASNSIRLLDGTSAGVTPTSPTYDAELSVRRGNQDSAELSWDETNNIWKIGTTTDKEQVARHTDAVTFASVVVDDTTINANTITRAGGALTLATTTSGDIKLEPIGGDVLFTTDSAGRQMKFTMGPATQTITTSGGLTVDAVGDITLDADGGDISLKDGGTNFGRLTNTSGNLIIKSGTTTAATFSGANVTFAGTITGGSLNTSASDLVGAINELKAQETTKPRSVLSGGNSITYTSGTGEIAVTTNSIAVSEMAGIDSNGTKYRALASNGSGNFIWTRKVPSIFDSDGTLLN